MKCRLGICCSEISVFALTWANTMSEEHSAATQADNTLSDRSLRLSMIALGLMLLAHLPLAITHHLTLWKREHYQFFPFAFGAFGWLLYTRRQRGAFTWDHLNSVLVLLDLLCLGAALSLATPSPLLVVAGLMFLLLAIARSLPDSEIRTSLGYLIILPLITFRPPWNYDLTAIQWLQRVTTSVASQLLNFFGYLHLRAGNVLEFPGKRFMVEEACSGVQSLFTLLFLAALIVCGYRRRWLHSLIVLATAAGLAGVMNVLRVCAVAIAWDTAQVDLSSGWQHDALGYAALVIAGLLVLSADACCAFFLSTVPDLAAGGISSGLRNPHVGFWNWMFTRPRRSETDQPQVNSLPIAPVAMGTAAVVCVVSMGWQMFALL